MKRLAWMLLLPFLSGCVSYSYRKSLMDHQSIEVAGRVYPFNYKESEITAMWRWDITR